ncbi:MAG: hypothetical protein FVQ85_09240 [Planctomycetes bacterium]|nr:hypothetical protein [Planctomycetota bacterium]
MNVNKVTTIDYEDKCDWTLGQNEPNTNPIKANSNPIKANIMPKQTQYEPKQTQLVLRSLWRSRNKPNSCPPSVWRVKGKKCCCQVNPHAGHRAGTAAMIKIVTLSLTLPGIDGTLSPLKCKEAD